MLKNYIKLLSQAAKKAIKNRPNPYQQKQPCYCWYDKENNR